MQQLDEVRERVAAAADRSGRAPTDVRIVAVSKGVPVERIQAVVDLGITDVGENRVQELQEKVGRVEGAHWHFVGALQTNKVRHLGPVELVHSLHRVAEAAALEKAGRPWDVLLEVNASGEMSKQGIPPTGIGDLLDELEAFSLVSPRGFMLMAPQAENPEDVRWLFTEGRKLRDQYEHRGLGELSMGMSDDYEVAIEEGATIVRIGRAIFGERHI